MGAAPVTLEQLLRAAGSGLASTVVSTAPDFAVNLANMLRAGYGMAGHKLGLLDASQMPDPIEHEDIPLTSASVSKAFGVGDSLPEAATEFVTGFASPSGISKKAMSMVPKDGSGKWKAVLQPKAVDLPKRYQSGEKEGIYRGTEAFGGITPAKLGSMRANYMKKMEKGEPGMYWYDEASDDFLRLTGGDTHKADDLTDIAAVTSSRTPVKSNFMYTAKGWNQRAVGDPIKTGGFPNNMGKQIEKALAGNTASGLKRSPFGAGLSVRWRGEDFANRPVHDIHDVRAWEIVDPKTGKPWSAGVGEAGHRFLDEQSEHVTKAANKRNLAGHDDWKPYRGQAAAWVAQKAQKEGISIEEAAKHYGDFIDDYSAHVTRSWIPGSNTGHLPELLERPELQKGFSDALERRVAGREGIDLVTHRLGGLSERTLPNAGLYEGVVEPGFTSRIPVGKTTGLNDMDPASRKLVRGVAATHGLLGAQKQSAYNYLGGPAAIKRAGAVQITRDTPIEGDELRELQEALSAAGADIAQADPKGARALVFNALAKHQVKAVREAAAKHGGEARFMHADSDIFPRDADYNAPEKWSAQPYIDEIKASGLQPAFDKGIPELAGSLLEETELLAKQHGMTSAPWYRPMMEAIQRGGLDELQRLVKAGVVPVTVLGLLGLTSLAGPAGGGLEVSGTAPPV